MILTWVRAAAAVVAAGLALAIPAAAWANTGAVINPGNVPTTAEDFDNMCDENFGGGPYPGQDVWVFVLPDISRDFVTVTASFSNGQTRTAPADGDIADDMGTSKAWVLAPAGWTLTAATAEVTGTAPAGGGLVSFNLTHTCPAEGSPSPSPRPSASITPFGGGSSSPSPNDSGTPTPGGESPSSGGGGGGTPRPSRGPETGGGGTNGVGNILLGGGSLLAAMVGAGVLFVTARRRRDLA